MTNNHIEKLIDISRYFGTQKEYVIAGGGNTSFKNNEHLLVKASGTSLATLTESGLVKMVRSDLDRISTRNYSDDPVTREEEVKLDLYRSIADPTSALRPSVETSLHNIISYNYVVHTHPTLVNGLLCARNSKTETAALFGTGALYIPYTDPGYILFKKILAELEQYRQIHGHDPKIILLENHGIFVSADTTDEIKTIYNEVENKIKSRANLPEVTPLTLAEAATRLLPALRMILSGEKAKILSYRHNSLIEHFIQRQDKWHRASLPFTPDMVVYCKSKYIYIDIKGTPEQLAEHFKNQLVKFRELYGYDPKVIAIKDFGLVTVGDTAAEAEILMDVFADLMMVSYLSDNFGGPRFMTADQIAFIENWEVENYRRKVSVSAGQGASVSGRIITITGAAQGFGAGIAQELFEKGANVVIADLNNDKGIALANQLNSSKGKNKALFVHTDVSQPESVQQLVAACVATFGGLDALISNAGVLRAGGLDELSIESFDFMTNINYKGYFLCAKYASEVFRTQHVHKPDYFMDIIQINSKSGLRGSNRNFSYAGGKFGGIGLTQSFALELVSCNVKVNAICPGNFFDGPLWSDPKTGLFVQYLNTGKVPGAKTLEEVKKYYENQVPMKRGCLVVDVVKAIEYVIGQQYETGQAIPVTGGQVMLN